MSGFHDSRRPLPHPRRLLPEKADRATTAGSFSGVFQGGKGGGAANFPRSPHQSGRGGRRWRYLPAVAAAVARVSGALKEWSENSSTGKESLYRSACRQLVCSLPESFIAGQQTRHGAARNRAPVTFRAGNGWRGGVGRNLESNQLVHHMRLRCYQNIVMQRGVIGDASFSATSALSWPVMFLSYPVFSGQSRYLSGFSGYPRWLWPALSPDRGGF